MAALIPGEELERLRGFTEVLRELRRVGTEGGLETLVDRTATGFGYDLATLRRDHGTERWSNARKLMRLAREFESREGPDLHAFLDYLEVRSGQRDREAEAASRPEDHSGVRVMTIHSAKGLEFGVVAVADLGRTLQLGWIPLRVAPGEEGPDGSEATRVGVQLGRLGRPSERLGDYQELTDAAAEREAEEEGRLAYVGATRAQRRLLLSGTFNPKAIGEARDPRKPIALQLIHGLLGGEVSERDAGDRRGGRRLPGRPAEGLRERARLPGPAPPSSPPGRLRQRHRPTTTPSHRCAGPRSARALVGGLSYSALSDFENCGYRFYVERVLGIAEPEPSAVTGGDGEEPAPERPAALRPRRRRARPARVERPQPLAGAGRGARSGGASRTGPGGRRGAGQLRAGAGHRLPRLAAPGGGRGCPGEPPRCPSSCRSARR